MTKCMSKFFKFFLVSVIFLNVPNTYSLPFVGQKIVISAASPLAVEYGKELAKKGGSVVDVAIGVALTMAVTNPYFASLGGGGFAVFRVGKNTEVLDFRETAPGKTKSD